MKERVEWLAVLRGLNILLVVMVHIYLVDSSTGLNHEFCSDMSFLFNPIRMPLFIFISGGLLYLSRIRKNIPTKSLYIDKAQRILIPYFFFILVYNLLIFIFNQLLKTPVSLSWGTFLKSFVYYRGYPSQPFWFLAVLMIFMLMYPLFCYLCKSWKRMVLFFLFCSGIFFIDTNLESPWNVFYILEIQHYLIFFFSGIFFFKYEIYKYMKKVVFLPITIALYLVSFYESITLLTSLLGIMMLCAICLQIANYLPKLFSSFREYIFQIYLMSLPCQLFLEQIYWKKLCYNEQFFYLFFLIDLCVGLFIPVLISKVIERCPNKLVRLCFGLQ